MGLGSSFGAGLWILVSHDCSSYLCDQPRGSCADFHATMMPFARLWPWRVAINRYRDLFFLVLLDRGPPRGSNHYPSLPIPRSWGGGVKGSDSLLRWTVYINRLTTYPDDTGTPDPAGFFSFRYLHVRVFWFCREDWALNVLSVLCTVSTWVLGSSGGSLHIPSARPGGGGVGFARCAGKGRSSLELHDPCPTFFLSRQLTKSCVYDHHVHSRPS